jgi:F-type H+-transporting ATPase subunit epsilon
MADTLKLEIVTPIGTAYSKRCGHGDSVRRGGTDGNSSAPRSLNDAAASGELIARKEGLEEVLAVGDGFVEITGKRVSIVTNMAVAAQDIDEAKAEEARQRAAARLREKLSSEEVASVNAALVRSLAQLRVKRRHCN